MNKKDLIILINQSSDCGEKSIINGLKTIFARLERTKVKEALVEIGVKIEDSFDQFKNNIDTLISLASIQNNLSNSEKYRISEIVAGVYQINILKSVLKVLV